MSWHKSQGNQMALNPYTSRPIKVGGKLWKSLVAEGVMDSGGYRDPNTYYEVSPEDYPDPRAMRDHLEEKKQVLNKKGRFPKGKHAVIKKNRLIGQRRKLTTTDASRSTADAAVAVIDDIQNNEVQIPQNMSRAEAHSYLQGIIFQKMLGEGRQFKNTKLAPTGRPKKKKRKAPRRPPPSESELSTAYEDEEDEEETYGEDEEESAYGEDEEETETEESGWE